MFAYRSKDSGDFVSGALGVNAVRGVKVPEGQRLAVIDGKRGLVEAPSVLMAATALAVTTLNNEGKLTAENWQQYGYLSLAVRKVFRVDAEDTIRTRDEGQDKTRTVDQVVKAIIISVVEQNNGVNKGWSFALNNIHHAHARRITNYYRKAATSTFEASVH